MQTTIHIFRFDTATPEGKADWLAFKAEKAKTHPRPMESLGNGSGLSRGFYYWPDLDGAPVTLEPGDKLQNLFDNQWNAAPIPGDTTANGRRLFDWAIECEYDNRGRRTPLRQGHWLEQTAEMREVRRNTYVCGYCGHKEAAQRGAVFCPQCIGSEYLTEKDLPLLRMLPVESSFNEKRKPLSEAERAHLLPLYVQAQTHGHTARDKARIAKARADVLADYAKTTDAATAKRDGLLWLMDRGIRTDNVIFYPHTGRFAFGWRTPLDADRLASLQAAIGAEFPFPYDIKTAEGRTLSAGV